MNNFEYFLAPSYWQHVYDVLELGLFNFLFDS